MVAAALTMALDTPSPPPPCLQFRQPPLPTFNAESLLQGQRHHPVLVQRSSVVSLTRWCRGTINNRRNYRYSIKIANCLFDNSIKRVAVTSSSSEAPPDITRRCRRAGDEPTPRWSLEQGNCHSKPPPKVNN